MFHRISRRALAALVALMLLAAFAGPVAGGTGDPGDRAEPTSIKALVGYDESLDSAGLYDRVGAAVLEDYETFALAELTPEQQAELAFSGVDVQPLTDLTWVRMTAYEFDTAKGEPELPSDLMNPGTGDGWYIVQYTGPIKEEWQAELEDISQEVAGYYPNYALLAYLTETARKDVAAWPQVNWVGPYHPAYRLAPELAGDQFSVVLFPGRGTADTEGKLADLGLTVTFYEGDVAIVEGAADQVQEAAKLDEVLYIDQFHEPELYNDTARGIIASNVPHGQGINGRPTNQIIAVTDTGIWLSHEVVSEAGKIVAFLDVAGDSGASNGDGHGHGTHVAGSALGDAPNAGAYLSYNSHDGQAFGARAIAVKVFNNWGWWAGGNNYYAHWNNAYNVAPNGARVNTNSWGANTGGAYSLSSVHADRVTWNHRDYVLTVAAGNSGAWGPNTIGTPAAAKNIITVGATETASPENVASFSSRGPCDDDRIKPDVMAPGDPILSAQRGVVNGYCNMSGTSMATPQVAGASALVRDYFQQGFYPTGAAVPGNAFTPTAPLVKATLINGAEEMTGVRADWNNEWRWPNNAQGWGRINLDHSLYFAGDTRNIIVWDDPVRLHTGGVWQAQFDVVDGSRDCKVTLTWTDYPATENAAVTLLNDFDLQVIAPDGTVFRGNNFTGLNPGYSVAGGAFNNRDTVEGVHLVPWFSYPGNLPVGTYTIRITARNIPRPTSNFAVVVGGSVGNVGAAPVNNVAVMGDYRGTIRRLLTGLGYNVTSYSAGAYAAVINNLSRHDVVVLNRVYNNTGFDSLLSAANSRKKGLIFCGSWPVSSHGMGVLSSRKSDPASVSASWGWGRVLTTVLTNHPVFTGYAAGQQLTLINGGDNDFQSYNNYFGTNLGTNDMPVGLPYMIGVKDRSATGGARHVVAGSLGACYWTNPRHWTADGQTVFANAINWSGAGTHTPRARVAVMGDYSNQLTQLLRGMGYRVTQFAWNDYNGVINALPNLDAVLLHRVSNSIGFDSLLANAANQDRGLVFLSSWPVSSHGMGVLSSRQGDPPSVDNRWGYGPVRFRVTQAHPVLNGFLLNQPVTIINGGDNDYQTFSGYGGSTIGTSLMPVGLSGMIGVKDRTQTGGCRHVVLGSFGACWYTHVGHWTPAARRILTNSIEWARYGAP